MPTPKPTETTAVYHAFGLKIASEIPFLDMSPVKEGGQISVTCGEVPEHISNTNAKVTGVRYEAGPGEFLLRVDQVAKYYVTNGKSIVVERKPGAADEEVLLFLMGSAMGALLHQRRILPLHAGAVQVDGGAVLFAGPSGIGKSTLVAALQKRGYSVLADDVCAVSATGEVIPGFPRLKLWADTLKKLGTEKTEYRRVRQAPDFKKYFVPFTTVCKHPMPVRSAFILSNTNQEEFEVSELKGMERIKPIMNHTYRRRFIEGLDGKQAHFKHCSRLANKARVINLVRPKKGFLLEELMDLVERYW